MPDAPVARGDAGQRDLARQRDIRDSPLYRDVEAYFEMLYAVGTGQIVDAADLTLSLDGRLAAFAGSRLDKLVGKPVGRICTLDIGTGALAQITHGPGNDRLPRFSADGTRIAFLSDRREAGVMQLYLLDRIRFGEAAATEAVPGTVEYFHWSPDGHRILLATAGRGADLAGMQGSRKTARAQSDLPDWMPQIDAGPDENLWRRLWILDTESGATHPCGPPGLNVWEAVWCGPKKIAAVVSDHPGEETWYDARLDIIDVATGAARTIARSSDQFGWPAASPSGRRLAVVQAVCSDRWVVCGDLLLIDPSTGAVTRVDTAGVDVSWLAWRDEDTLFYVGKRAFDTVMANYDAVRGTTDEILVSAEVDGGPWFPTATPVGRRDALTQVEGWAVPPAITMIADGRPRTLASLGHDRLAAILPDVGTIEPVRWNAPDGLEIHGWLVRPRGDPPYPLVVDIHGGPVWVARNRWLARQRHAALLAKRGYAVLYPNPRGSSTRGQQFARLVKGDMGGADTHDVLSGLDAMVARGIADPRRLGVIGVSYGGFMAAWLITQDDRFAAAVPISPATDWYSTHWTCNIPRFDELYLGDRPDHPGGRYYERSPVMFANRAKTPTLTIAGAQDRCTPPGQAEEFHRALLEAGVDSVLAVYPLDGHGVRDFPAQIDNTARILAWFERHMPT